MLLKFFQLGEYLSYLADQIIPLEGHLDKIIRTTALNFYHKIQVVITRQDYDINVGIMHPDF